MPIVRNVHFALSDATNDVHFSIRVHGDGGAELTRATCSAASVHERFDIVRKFVVNDQIDVRNVQSARRDVGGDENRETVIATLQGARAAPARCRREAPQTRRVDREPR